MAEGVTVIFEVSSRAGDAAQPLLLHGLRAAQCGDRRVPLGQDTRLPARSAGHRSPRQHDDGAVRFSHRRSVAHVLHFAGAESLFPR